jgi:nitrate/nitrite transport system substrate-binding protein
MVFPFSQHNYLLRYWLAAAGIHPDRDLRLIVIPPPQMGAALAAGTIDGFCSGGPWNQAAVQAHAGEVIVTGYEIWNNAPEKVFGVSETWAQENPNTHLALVCAMIEASQWLENSANLSEAAHLLAAPNYVGVSSDLLEPSLRGKWRYCADQPAVDIPDYHVFHRYAANFPWISHGIWILTQMCRWGQIPMRTDFAEIAQAIYRPDLYRAAAGVLGVTVPPSDFKHEGSHGAPWTLDGFTRGADRFFDGRAFDPSRPLAYLEGFEHHNMRGTSAALALAT